MSDRVGAGEGGGVSGTASASERLGRIADQVGFLIENLHPCIEQGYWSLNDVEWMLRDVLELAQEGQNT